MHACTSLFIFIYIHVCIQARACKCVLYVCWYTCACVCKYACLYLCACMCKHICDCVCMMIVRMYLCVCICACACMYVCLSKQHINSISICHKSKIFVMSLAHLYGISYSISDSNNADHDYNEQNSISNDRSYSTNP